PSVPAIGLSLKDRDSSRLRPGLRAAERKNRDASGIATTGARCLVPTVRRGNAVGDAPRRPAGGTPRRGRRQRNGPSGGGAGVVPEPSTRAPAGIAGLLGRASA